MIQRIQTLYLLAIVALGITLCFMPAMQLFTPEQVYTLGFCSTVPDLPGLWVLSLTTALIPLLALIDIFLYRRRILQARLNIFLACLCLGYYAVLATFVWFAGLNLHTDWQVTVWASFPLVSLILTLMATRRILKDEALVRAADRIR